MLIKKKLATHTRLRLKLFMPLRKIEKGLSGRFDTQLGMVTHSDFFAHVQLRKVDFIDDLSFVLNSGSARDFVHAIPPDLSAMHCLPHMMALHVRISHKIFSLL